MDPFLAVYSRSSAEHSHTVKSVVSVDRFVGSGATGVAMNVKNLK